MPTEPKERRKRYLKRKKSGLCPRCGGKVKKSSPYSYCDDCREYYRSYTRVQSDSIQEVRRERYEQRKQNNCCPRCGVKMVKKATKTICSNCLDKQYLYNTGNKRPKKLKNKL